MEFDEYLDFDALGLARLVATGQITSAELMETALAAIDRLDPKINAVVIRDDVRARAGVAEAPAGRPFSGVPFPAKDINVRVSGWPLTNACRFFADAPPDQHDDALVARWRAAGLVICGRTNTSEFATDYACEPDLYGPTLNPWDPGRTPGGSSGGAAAAVAAGMVPMAHASDSGGSIRLPAACCGVFGYKPSAGLVATGAAIGPLVGGFNCDHVITRSVRDSAAMLDATAAPERPFDPAAPVSGGFLDALDKPPPRLRIGLATTGPGGEAVQHEIAQALEQAAALLAGLGHEILHFDWPQGAAPGSSADPLWTAEIALMVDRHASALGRHPAPGEIGPVIEEALRIAGAMTIREAAHRRLRRWEIRHLMDHAMTLFDVILSPVTSEAPLPSGLLSGLARDDLAAWGARAGAFAPHTEIFNLTGQPAMSLPLCHDAAGLPIGVQLAGRLGSDRLMLQLAREVEQARPWAHRRPQTR